MNEILFQVLLQLKDGALDAEAILESMAREKPGFEVPAIASFYRALKKASDAGYLAVEKIESEGRGRPRQRYALTRAGRAALETEARRLARLAEAVLGARK